MVPEAILTRLHFLLHLLTFPLSQSVGHCKAFLALCNVTLWLIGAARKLIRKPSFVNTVPGAVLTRLHFLLHLLTFPLSQSVGHCKAFLALCNVTLQLIGVARKLRRKSSFLNMVPEAIFTTLHYLPNLLTFPISQSVCHCKAFLALCNVTLWLIGAVRKFR